MNNKKEKKTEFRPWRTFPIFISSTFRDMQAERDYLKNKIFPKLEDELKERRIKLAVVDLRWGIDTSTIESEDEREATVLKVCLDEIENCRPFFIGLLGDRYGWVPSEERMKTAITGKKGISHKKNKSVTSLEIEFGVLASNEKLSRSTFYFRNPFDYSRLSVDKKAQYNDEYDPELTANEKKERINALKALKKEIIDYFEEEGKDDKVKKYHTEWDDETKEITGLEEFGRLVYDDILEECKKHAAENWNEVPKNEYERENLLLEAFIEERVEIFCGREKMIPRLKQHLLNNGKEKWGMLLTGESGSGKSSVFSKIYKEMLEEDCLILSHSAGISSASCQVYELMKKWNRQLRDFLRVTEEPAFYAKFDLDRSGKQTKSAIEKQTENFKELLFTAADKTHIILLIDALDRFEPTERAEYMTWLPQVMPGSIRLLCTAITDTEKKAAEYNKNLFTESIEYFSEDDAHKMLEAICKQKHKTLHETVVNALFYHKRKDGQLSVSSPLWLSLAVNMLTALDADDFEKMSKIKGRGDQQIKSYITQLVEAFPVFPGELFLDLLKKAGKVFGKDFTQNVFNFLACSRNGLRESDLEKLLSEEKGIDWDPLYFSGIRFWFKGYLREQGNNRKWNLAHSILRNSIQNSLSEMEFKNVHNAIANHLLSLQENDVLRMSETMFHLMKAENADRALDFYIDCTEEEHQGVTAVLVESISQDEKNLDWCFAIMKAAVNDETKIRRLASRYIHELNDALKVEGKLVEREKLHKTLHDHIKTNTNLSSYSNGLDHYITQINYSRDLLYVLAELYERLGVIYQSLGKLKQALKFYESYCDLIVDLYENDPNPMNEILRLGLALSYQNLGVIYQSLGKLEAALKWSNSSHKLMKELYESNPRNESMKHNLAISYSRLGSIFQSHAKLDNLLDKNVKELWSFCFQSDYDYLHYLRQARAFYNNFNHLMEELCESNPSNENMKYWLAISHSSLGSVYQSLFCSELALEFNDNFIKLMKELYESNPRNESLKHNLAISYSKQGLIHQSLGKFKKALEFYIKDAELSKELHESNPWNIEFLECLGLSYYNLAMVYIIVGNNQSSRESFKKWSKIINLLTYKFPQVQKYQKWKKRKCVNSLQRFFYIIISWIDPQISTFWYKMISEKANLKRSEYRSII
ncbi:MAG: DUF4062 domain-containing protein [Candidatus Tenebribacter davisii]|nr:DUF4062 domain-containing protein [Candidatus Tenebribacter davisii]